MNESCSGSVRPLVSEVDKLKAVTSWDDIEIVDARDG